MAVINGTDGSDQLTGGAENDTLIGSGGADTMDGGGGWNVVAYWTSGNAVGVQLGRGLTSNDGFNGTDILLNIHGVFGSAFSDILLGSDWGDLLAGLGGNDTLEGYGGDDALNGHSGDDRVSGGAGNDTAYFGGNRADYTVTAINGGFTIAHNTSYIDQWGTEVNEGTDTVTEVEAFQFADGVFSAEDVLNPSGNRPTADDDSLTGTARGDRIDALAGNDTVNGAGGDDTLIGGAGDDLLDGGAGRDVVSMGNVGFRGAGVGFAGGDLVLTTAAGTDTLRNVEVVVFADGRLVFDAEDAAAKVARLYEAALDRLPDQHGLNFWIDQVQSGAPLSNLASGFLASDEFRLRYGDMADNGAFVDRLYQNVLGREGEAAGRQGWIDLMNRGAGRAQVLEGFSESAENKAGTAGLVADGIWDRSETAAEVARLYDTVLGRAPDAAGLAGWTAMIDGGMPLAQAADGFTGSAEFQAKYGGLDNRAFATELYRNTLDREPDRAGLDGWVDLLNKGMARSDVVLGFSESAEHVLLTAADIGGDTPGQFGIVFA